MMDPAGPQAGAILGLWWFTLVLFGIVFVVVMGALVIAVARRRREDEPEHPTLASAVTGGDEADRRLTSVVAAAVAATVLILFVYLFVDLRTARALHRLPQSDALTIRVTGNQWWWDIEYEDTIPARRLRTANEIHIPVGRAVRIRTESADVIHSFWVPALHGKRDLIPGQRSEIWLRADSAGIYQGQCAEFCGHQHARMRLLVIAQQPDEFDAWYAAQLRPALPPAGAAAERGQQVFLSGPCVLCHSIRGTLAGARTGPDLTHLASRRTLAGGTLPNRRGHLAGWILDPQRIKPGARMPPNPLSPRDLDALLDFLQGLR